MVVEELTVLFRAGGCICEAFVGGTLKFVIYVYNLS